MGCNPCCCFSLKDSAVTVGIWTAVYSIASLFIFGWQTGVLNHCRSVTMSQANLQCEWDCPCVGASTARTTRLIEGESINILQPPIPCDVFSIAQLGIMGWQMAAIKYEKDRAANTLLPNYNTYGRYDIPSYYESYWQSPEERYYTGLFVIQILCLIAAFFLLFASVAMMYGVHSWSRYLVWPWFPCMVSSILCSLAYCIMWWAGDVRDYWLALTIIEILGVFINVYCLVVVMMYYRRITSTTDEYEGKDRRVGYKVNRRGYSSRRDLLDSHDGLHQHRSPDQIKSPYTNYNQPVHQAYPSPYSPAGVPQTPLPLPPNYTPYPLDMNEMMSYRREPKTPTQHDIINEDPVAHWVKSQQRLDRGEANSEPISPSKEVAPTFPLQQSRSVPSIYDGTLVSHKSCRHRKGQHRSSSRRHRSKSRHLESEVPSPYYSSDSESRTDFGRRRESGRRNHRSKSRYSESEVTATTDHRHKEHKDRHRHRDDRDREERRRRKDDDARSSRRRRHDDRDRGDRGEERPRREEREHGGRGGDRVDRDDDGRESRRKHRQRREREEQEKEPLPEPVGDSYPLAGGITIPQHIVIPPSSGERGPDGLPLPQKFQINSEITINYDQNGMPQTPGVASRPEALTHEPYRGRYAPMQITSNV